MANTINIPKAHLIMALCLPLAVLLGYFVADPLESGSLAVLVLVLFVLAVPLLMKWHHPMLFLSWNCGLAFYFLPGQPGLWVFITAGSLIFAVLNRSVSERNRFVVIPSLAIPLLVLVGVVVVTAMLSGGVGMRTLGSRTFGGRKYALLVASVAGFFAFTSQRVPAQRVGLYLALFFLPGLSSLTSLLAYWAGPSFYFLYDFFSSEGIEQLETKSLFTMSIIRYSCLVPASLAVLWYLLARHGLRDLLDMRKPWRLLLLLAAMTGLMLGGFRSAFIMAFITMAVMFVLEGLWRTRWLPLGVLAVLLLGVWVLPQLYKMPLSVQRTLSFLPVRIDAAVRADAEESIAWRLEVWRQAWPEVSKHLIVGKGYAISANDLYMALQFERQDNAQQWASVSQEYHNGPLSILIPFGLGGAVAFLWFVAAAVRYLYQQYRYGDPTLKKVNTYLLAAFIAKVVFFLALYGGIENDLWAFTGLLGLAVSLNGEPVTATVPVEEEFALSQAAEPDLVT